MKTVFLIITMLCLGLSGMAQNNEKKELERKYSALTQEVANARKQKDYKKAEKLNWEKLKLYQGLPQQLQENAKNITGDSSIFEKSPATNFILYSNKLNGLIALSFL